MATPEEIRQRVEQTDTARSARRAAAAQQVGELAQRRAAIIKQLEDVERELGDVVVEAQDVIDIDELAEFTDLKPAELSDWLASRKTARGRRRKTTSTPGAPARRRPAESKGPLPAPREDASNAGRRPAPDRLAASSAELGTV